MPRYELALRRLSPGSVQGGVLFRSLTPSSPPPPLWGWARREGRREDERSRNQGGSGAATGPGAASPGTALFALEPQAASLGPLFARHRQVVRALFRHYTLGRLGGCLLLGRGALPELERDVLLRVPPARSSSRE